MAANPTRADYETSLYSDFLPCDYLCDVFHDLSADGER